MRGSYGRRPDLDEGILPRVAELTPAGQRWLKMALEVINSLDEDAGEEVKVGQRTRGPTQKTVRPTASPSLDEILSGEADIRQQAEKYPDLAKELREIADIADLLREAGAERRRLGEEILNESDWDKETGAG